MIMDTATSKTIEKETVSFSNVKRDLQSSQTALHQGISVFAKCTPNSVTGTPNNACC